MESSNLPLGLTATPSPLIGLVGLDAQGRHSHIWRVFSAGYQGPGVTPERLPLRWTLLTDLTTLPQPKPKRSSYEWFIPKGILKVNWLNKHLNVLPALVVVFMELDWSDSNWSEKKTECISRVQSVRTVLQGRATKLAVVLIQRENLAPEFSAGAAGGPDAAISSERAAELCSACELSARSLFVLPVIGKDGASISDGPTLSGYVSKLENAFYEVAQNYYHLEIRNVKSHRDYLNKTTHLYLFVRHQFKAGFLNELKRDQHAAYKHYQQAYNLLMEVRATDTNIMEVKTVAGFINYKICRLAFHLNLPRDAIAQFRRHMDIFKQKIGLEGLAFEHSGWQADQSRTFAEIFSDAIRHGLPAIQTQHPGLYYQQAAQFAILRRKSAEELCNEVTPYPDPDPLANENNMDFYGQRPWRPGKVSIEPPDMELERIGIRALLCREKELRSNHSDLIVDLLSKAIDQFKTFRSPRAQSHLSVQMAEEMMAAQKYRQALDLLRPIVSQYRKQGWSVLLNAGLSLGLKCAYLTASIEDYVSFGLELSAQKSDKSSSSEAEDKQRILSNVVKLFGNSGQIPSAEPGLTSKAERGAVGDATQIWSNLLSNKSDTAIVVKMDYDISKNSCIKVLPVFEMSKLKADQKMSLTCFIKNDSCPSDNPDLALPIQDVQIYLAQPSDPRSGQPRSTRTPVVLQQKNKPENVTLLFPGKTAVFFFEYLPESEDVGKRVVAEKIFISLGKADSNIRLQVEMSLHDLIACEAEYEKETEFFVRRSPKYSELDVTDGMTSIDIPKIGQTFSRVEIEPRTPNVKMEIICKGPILVNEWFIITVKLTNEEKQVVNGVTVSASLTEANDPIISDTTRLVLDYRMPEPMTPMTPSENSETYSFASPPATKKISEISPSEVSIVKFYLRASTTAQRSVSFAVEYLIGDSESSAQYKCYLADVLNFETVEPFVVGSELSSIPRQLTMEAAYTDEPFLLLPELKSISEHSVKIVDTSIEVRHPVQKLGQVPSQLAGCTLEDKSVGNECYSIVVQKKNLIKDLMSNALEEQDVTIGRYIIKWIREEYEGSEDYDPSFVSVSTYELPSIRICTSSIYASARIRSTYAIVRTPLQVTYTFINRSDRVQEFLLNMEPSEAFMLSGNKQLHFKLMPSGGSVTMNYVFYPLLAGESVPLPRPKLTSVRLSSHPQDDDVTGTLDRLLATHITVLPRKRDKEVSDVPLTSRVSCSTNVNDKYEVTSPVFMQNSPFPPLPKLKMAF